MAVGDQGAGVAQFAQQARGNTQIERIVVRHEDAQ
jgi:hypothetical protein